MLSCRNALNSPFPSRATGAADEEAKLFTDINISNNPSIGIVLLLSEIAIIIGAFAHMKSAKRLQEQQQSDSASPLTNVDTNTELDNLCARLETELETASRSSAPGAEGSPSLPPGPASRPTPFSCFH